MKKKQRAEKREGCNCSEEVLFGQKLTTLDYNVICTEEKCGLCNN